MKLTGVVLTKNEEINIKRCLKSLNFCDEIIVIDDESKDKTKEIVNKLGVKAISRSLNNSFSGQRNFALKKALGEWVLFVDADEIVTSNLKNEIIQRINSPFNQSLGFYLKRQDHLWGKKMHYGENGSNYLLRLAKKDAGTWKRDVHEVWKINGKTSKLKSALFHYPHNNLNDLIKNINYFSSIHAQSNMKEGKRSSLTKILIWPAGKLFVILVVRRGCLDGVRGFVMAFMMSLHSFLAWSKLWLLRKKKRSNS